MNFRISGIKYQIPIIIAAVMVMTACDPEAKAVSGQQVEITIEQQIVSSGFVSARFSTNKEAYYHIGILPDSVAPDLSTPANIRSFMSLTLDRAYADYLYWRYDLLLEGTPYVAEFASHALQYGTVEQSFTMLTPGTDYMIYAFPVDAKTNKPNGRLFVQHIGTAKTSVYEDMHFVYRVQGLWDYVYPTAASGEILYNAPWGGETIDSAALVEYGYASPAAYFAETFEAYQLFQANELVHFGIYVHNNDGEWDGRSATLFESGHTYYTSLALMDGYLSKKAAAIYKFRWENSNTQYTFNSSQSLVTEW